MSRRATSVLVLFLALGLLVLEGCEQEDLVRPDRNSPPETILSVAPDLGDRVFHKYLVRWTGLDRDGVVTRYRVATVAEDELYGGLTSPEDVAQYLLGLSWGVTDVTESLFVFRADRPNSRSHSLYVAAIDNESKVDPTPAVTNFLAVDYGLPNVWVKMTSNLSDTCSKINRDTLIAPAVEGDTLPGYNLDNPSEPIFIRFIWGGEDPDGRVTGWRYRLDSGIEVPVESDVDTVRYKYDPNDMSTSDLGLGFHEFRLVATDDAGARSIERVARFVINYDPQTVVDSVWVFRESNWGSVPEKLIWPNQADTVVYHFGRLRFKFHASDRDRQPGALPPDTFNWRIKGSLFASSPIWFTKKCGELYCDSTKVGDAVTGPFMDTDITLSLLVRARDDRGKADGTPAAVRFVVNYPPQIPSISYEMVGPGTVRIAWPSAFDSDEDTGRGPAGEQALMKYRYRIDGGAWEDITEKDGPFFVKYVEVGGLAPGPHKFTLLAYNGAYFETRSDTKEIEFVVEQDFGGGGR